MSSRFFCIQSVAFALAFGGFVASSSGGDKVILSKPDQEVVAPREADPVRLQKAPLELRQDGAKPQVDVPYVRPPQVRIEPRKQERKNIFGDPVNPFVENRQTEEGGEQNSLWSRGSSDRRQPFVFTFPEETPKHEQERALSPIRQFDWSPEEQPGQKQSPIPDAQPPLWSKRDGDTSNPGLFGVFGRRQDGIQNARETGRSGILTLFKAEEPSRDVKRESARDQTAWQDEFQKMINPTFSPLGRNTSADPFGTPEIAKSAAPVMPIAPSALQGRSLDPMQAFKEPQPSWRGPSIDDLNRRSFGAVSTPPPQPASSASATAPKTPLIRQPIYLEVPSRSF